MSQDVANGIRNNRASLINDAESKVTGLSYGIIGDSLDMVAYSIDDFLARQKQRKKAYAEAEEKASQFRKQHTSEGNKLFSEFVANAIPYLHQGIDSYIDALCMAENDYLIKAGLIDGNIEKAIDIPKSYQLMSSIAEKKGDNSFAIALALKLYPCNITAFVYAEEHGYQCQGLYELIHFLGFKGKIKRGINESIRKRVLVKANALESISDGNAGVAMIKEDANLLDEIGIKSLLETLATAISPRIEKILSPDRLDSITNVQDYCANELEKVISHESWVYFEEHSVSPIDSTVLSSADDYSELQELLCKQIDLKIKDAEQKYSAAREKLSRAKSIKDYENAASSFEALGTYKASSSLYRDIENTIKEKEKRKRKTIVISVLTVIAVVIFAILCITSYVNNKPYKELKEALDSRSFSTVWTSHVVSNHDQKALQIVVNKLSSYHSNNDVESALALLTELRVAGIDFGEDTITSSGLFINWIKESAMEKGNEGSITPVSHSDQYDKLYIVYGYQLGWNSSALDSLGLYVSSRDDWYCISSGNSPAIIS